VTLYKVQNNKIVSVLRRKKGEKKKATLSDRPNQLTDLFFGGME